MFTLYVKAVLQARTGHIRTLLQENTLAIFSKAAAPERSPYRTCINKTVAYSILLA